MTHLKRIPLLLCITFLVTSGVLAQERVIGPGRGGPDQAPRKIKFIPATKDGRYVSMWMQLEYNFNLY